MDIWQKHAQKLRRQDELERFDRWLLEHPGKSWLIAIVTALSVFSLAQLLELALDALARSIVGAK